MSALPAQESRSPDVFGLPVAPHRVPLAQALRRRDNLLAFTHWGTGQTRKRAHWDTDFTELRVDARGVHAPARRCKTTAPGVTARHRSANNNVLPDNSAAPYSPKFIAQTGLVIGTVGPTGHRSRAASSCGPPLTPPARPAAHRATNSCVLLADSACWRST